MSCRRSTNPVPRPVTMDKYTAEDQTVFLTGVQALVRVVLDAMRRDRLAGLRTASLISGYPGSPLGGFDQELSRHRALLKDLDIVHLPGHNEELAATAVAGSQLAQHFRSARFDGVLGVWYGKAPGLDRALDAIWHGQFTGASSKGGVLLFVGDDPECKSSMIPSASEHTLASARIPVLYPGTVEEVLELGTHGVALSRVSGLWTALKIVAGVADGIATASTGKLYNSEGVGIPAATPYVPAVRPPCVPDSLEAEQEIATVRTQVALQYARAADLNQVTINTKDAWIGIVAAGSVYREVLGALARLGLDPTAFRRYGIRVMQVKMLHPLEPQVFRAFSRGLREVLVVEEKRPLLEPYLREALYGTSDTPKIIGREDEFGRPLLPGYGVIRSAELAEVIATRLCQRVPAEALGPPRLGDAKIPLPLVQRTPFFCSGCPHNTSTRVPEGALVGVGTGCHALGFWADEAMVGTTVTKAQMGGEGATWLGLEPFVGDDHIFQNMGDGTYFHSGQLAVQAAVAAGSHITFKLLYNSAIAMTGGQDPAESNSRPVSDVAEILLRQGVKQVIITTDDPKAYRGVHLPGSVRVWPRSRVVEAQVALARVPGVTVLIHDQRCAAEKRRDRTRGKLPSPTQRVYINERVCEGCGDCGVASNCLSVEPTETELGRKTTINQVTCNADYSCLNGNCPSFVTVRSRTPKRAANRPWGHRTPGGSPPTMQRAQPPRGPDLGALQSPQPRVDSTDFTVRMPGIGGTGVVTVSQIIGTAAAESGCYVIGRDQTGLSQKAGPVVSDLRVSTSPLEGSSQASPGAVDLLLGFDPIVTLAPRNLETVAPGKTLAVVSSSPIPTANMITHTDRSLPSVEEIQALFSDMVGPDRLFLIDTMDLSRRLLGSTTFANVLLLGVAFQVGALPLPVANIERSIEMNGVAVPQNLAAFRWGRIWVADRGQVTAAVGDFCPPRLGRRHDIALPSMVRAVPELAELVATRASDLERYQNRPYARHYIDVVERAAEAEARAVPGCHLFSSRVARNLYKLMAYKDEYEVARLHLEAPPSEATGRHVRVSWNLEPPIFKALGHDKKIRLGSWFRYVFLALRLGRHLRGTPFDPFGHAKIRRIERRLANEFTTDIAAATSILTPDNYDRACALAGLPDIVRGYDEVKLRNVANYQAAREELLLSLLLPVRDTERSGTSG